jgi:trehalose 6-phosphate synthase/phosphatase
MISLSDNVQQKMATIKDIYAGKKIIISRDKLDMVTGVRQKLQCFEKFLALYPEWRNKVFSFQIHHDRWF